MTTAYYDALAPYYKYIYPDWDDSIERQSAALNSVIREFVAGTVHTVLDVACGIGTQSIGLAKIGYQVTAADISSGAIKAAKREAARHDVEINFQAVDMQQAWEDQKKQYDLIIACDNAVPHLLSDGEILHAFKQFYQCTRLGGACIITVRDYAQLDRKAHSKQLYPRRVHATKDGQIVMFDVWDFYDVDHYEITTYLLEDNGSTDLKTSAIRGGKYYCVEIPILERLFIAAGFQGVIVLKDRFFQPLLLAVKGIGRAA